MQRLFHSGQPGEKRRQRYRLSQELFATIRQYARHNPWWGIMAPAFGCR